MVLMMPPAAVPKSEACPEPNPSHPSNRKGSLPKVFLGLALLLLVGCAGASIIAEPDPSRPPAGGGEAVKTGLVEPSPDLVSEPSPNPVGNSRAPAQVLAQQADHLGDGRPVEPASLPSASSPSVENAGKESVPALPAPAGPDPVASDIPAEDVPSGDNPSGVPQSEPESAPAVKENPAEANSPPVPELFKAPADETKESSSQATFPLAPPFTLTSASGEQVSLETYRSESNVVLVFFRGFW